LNLDDDSWLETKDSWPVATLPPPADGAQPQLPVGPRALDAATTALEKRAQFISAWESLTEQQRVFLNTWRESRFNANRAMRILAGTTHRTSKTSISNWGANEAFELVRNTLREASVEEILSRASLVARHDDIVETALTPKPILYQGEHTGFEEVDVSAAARANETLMKVGGLLKDKEVDLNVGIIGPSFTIQVVQPQGNVIDVTPRGVPVQLPEPEVADADWID
jgi:hypothetical protein